MASRLAQLVPSWLRRMFFSGDDGPSTSSSSSGPTPRSSVRRVVVGGPFTTGVPGNPETSFGLLAAVAEPVASSLRVANKPIRTGGIRGIMTERSTLRVNNSCRLCSYRLERARVYMYMFALQLACSYTWGMMFCSRGCRFDFFMEALYRKRHLELTGLPAGDQISAAMKRSLVSAEDEEYFRKIFFCR